MEELKVTPISELVKASQGEVVPLPRFANGMEFNVRLRKPSILGLAKSGKIPNDLLVTANELFSKGGKAISDGIDDSEMLKKLFDVMDVMCEASFVEPSYQQLKDAGVELTDEQFMAVFNYTQSGVINAKPTVQGQENNKHN